MCAVGGWGLGDWGRMGQEAGVGHSWKGETNNSSRHRVLNAYSV